MTIDVLAQLSAENDWLKKQLAFSQQFFLALGVEQKAAIRHQDVHRLEAIRASASYQSAFKANPKISIIIPAFNRADIMLERTIPSVLAQDYQNWELIIIGDQMSNESAAKLANVSEIDPRIGFYNLKRRGRYPDFDGPRWYVAGTKPVNFGLRIAKGQWIAHLDDDDEFLPDHLSSLLRTAQLAKAEWAHAQVLFKDDHGLDQTIIGAAQPVQGGISRISSIYHAGLKTFRYNINCWRYCYPGDWDLWERFLAVEISHIHLPKITAIHHGDVLGVINSQGVVGSELGDRFGSNQLRTKPRIAIVLHLFYLDQWEEIAVLLKNIPIDFDLIVTTTPESQQSVIDLLTNTYPAARLYITENRGRDIAPLLTVLQNESLSKYDFVCKLHTKKSPHLDPELVQKWRNELLISLLPSQDGVEAIFDLFNTRPEVGIVTGAGVLVHAHYTPGGNINLLRELAARLGFNLDEMAYEFPGGSMFWCRGRVFNSFNALNITADDFEPELGQTNGTLAHAIERLFPLIAYHQGLLTVDAGYQGNVPNPRFPNSSEEYLHWLSKQELSIPEAKLFDLHTKAVALPKVKICIVDRFGNKSGLIETINSVSRQFYANVELLVCSISANPMPASGIEWLQVQDGFYSAILAGLAEQECAWLGVLEAGDQLTMSGLLLAMHQIVDRPDWEVVYFDDDVMNADGRPACPRFKPDFDINLLRSIPYADGLLLLKTGTGFTDVYRDMEGWGTEQLAILLHCFEQDGAGAIGHVPEVLTHLQINESRQLSNPRRYQGFSALIELHLQRQKITAEVLANGRVEGALRVKYALPARPLVSIIIPTKNQLPMLQRCIESILEKTSYPNYEIIIIDNNSDDPLVLPYLEQLELLLSDRLRVFSYPHAFNFSAINNAAVGQANGEYLVLLNNDTAMIQNSWLDELLHHAMRPEVGIVGAKLLYPNGLVQHAGVVLGLRGPADHPSIGASLEESGYMHRLQLDQQYSVVTAACMMIRKSVYEQVGGMDEVDFKVSYNDVDLCLKVGRLGYQTVWTPYAVVMHEGSVSQSQVDPDRAAAKQKRFEGEQVAMYRKWLPEIGNDPAYNKNLTLSGNGFELEHRSLLSWRPLSWKPLPVVLCHPADRTGCGQYRILQPFAAMQEAQKISGAIAFDLYPAFELAKLAPDVMVFQRQLTEQQLECLRLSKLCSPSFKIYELDDYLPNVPIKSVHRAHMPKDVVKSLRKALTLVDRFTVSTDELANAYQGMHSVMHVVNNYLPVPIWGDLQSARRQGKKPRVGWAGGASHTGDLELIESVVKALANEVEWVFFGMCPDKLRPFVDEFHSGVPIGLYPAKLASLDLDLALAPLEQNIFNQCKSNLRLLEYGICGFPVICTDIAPYRCDLPVTRVKNKHKDWVDAIREHLFDLDEAARRGDALKAAVLKDWMLDGVNLDKWRAAWLPS